MFVKNDTQPFVAQSLQKFVVYVRVYGGYIQVIANAKIKYKHRFTYNEK